MSHSNLLIILSDEHQAGAMGCAAHPFVKTPNLDKLAARGMRFSNAYTPSPICVPARASFATGRYTNQIRLWDNAMPYTGNIPGWGHALQKASIPVESIGKLHYRDKEDPVGFDVEHIPMMVANGVGMVWASVRKEDERVSPGSRMLGNYIGPGNSAYTDYDAAITDRTIQWLESRAQSNDTPWCLYVGLVAPHFPLVVPQEFYDLYPVESLPVVKQHPSTGYQQHPWVAKQNQFMDSESKFTNAEERLAAMASYYGLCSWLDSNIGKVLNALDSTGLASNTTVVYSSDHGDNVGARGLWGKSNMYEESCAIPMIMAGPDIEHGTCDTPVSLLDLSVTISSHFSLAIELDEIHGDVRGQDLRAIAAAKYDDERVVFSEYHAAGAVTGAFMIRRGPWKYIYYVGFEPELFNLVNDPEELVNLANKQELKSVLNRLHEDLLNICNPENTDAQAHADQAAMIQRYGGRESALKLGAPAATPAPRV
jgi:choline-sulfatase